MSSNKFRQNIRMTNHDWSMPLSVGFLKKFLTQFEDGALITTKGFGKCRKFVVTEYSTEESPKGDSINL